MRRPVLLVIVSGVLAVAAVALLVAGVQVRETTGGLLVTPIRQLHLVGGFLVAGTVVGVAAVLTALAAVPVRRATRPVPGEDAAPESAPAPSASTGSAPASVAPGSGRDT
ncbi:hypothetical protein PHK61_06975 [Actinomycetospora lutea]|uniref:hypothetical protein n=1 Tax=Actinomycetospora lutea TaxID=663604 RepID=UPI00236646FC|nr:hypothetical protein [Actinomycetospora lutea]MDD7938158.1 hypothetical protein [Actinomycetospora lutea]